MLRSRRSTLAGRAWMVLPIVLLLLCLGATHAFSAPVFSDSFESGLAGWTPVGNVTTSTSVPVGGGTYSAMLTTAAGVNPSLTRTISTHGYNTIAVSFSLRFVRTRNGQNVHVDWFDGTTWTTLVTLTSNTSTWGSYSYSLPANAADNPNFALRVVGTYFGAVNSSYFDLVSITGNPLTYTVDVSGANGSLLVDSVPQALPYHGSFPYNTTVNLQAVPNATYHFTGWSGSLTGSTNPTSIVVDNNKVITAGFALTTYTLDLSGTHGTVLVDGTSHTLPWSGTYTEGTSVTLEAVPDATYHFTGWSGALTGFTNPTSITMDANKSVGAGFSLDTYSLDIGGINGTVLVDGLSQTLPYHGTYNVGASVTLEAVPDAGYVFTGWSGDLTGSTNPTSVTIDGNESVTAGFALDMKVLSLGGTHGSVIVNGTSHAVPWSGAFPVGSSVTLEAVPDSTYIFNGWSGGLTGSTNPTSITMDADKSVTVSFVVDMKVLSLGGTHGSVLVNGTSRVIPWSGPFVVGTSVTLEAVPDSGYIFTGWSGALTGSTNPTSVTMDADKSVTVGFGLDVRILSLTGTNGAVTVDGVSHALPWSGPIATGSSVTLEAIPDTNYHFTAWSGDLTGSTNPTSITMDTDKTIGAGFALDDRTLSLTGSNGTVTVNGTNHALPWSGTFPHGTSVTLLAVPDATFRFDLWSGDLTGSTNPATITMDADKSIGAGFVSDVYTLAIAGSNGTVTVDGTSHTLPWSASFANGAVVNLEAVPAATYHFTGWSGDLTGSTNPTTITVNADKSVTASFAINTYALNLSGANGTVRVDGVAQTLPYSHTFDAGAGVSLEALPDTGYSFSGWSGDLTGSTNPTTVTMDAVKNITVGFSAVTYQLTLTGTDGSVNVNGTTHALPWSGTFGSGAVVSLAAVPNTGYHFTGWSGDLTGSTDPTTITMDGDKSVALAFAINSYTLDLTGSNGTVTVDGVSHALPWSASYDHGTSVTLQAVPASGYTFTGWSGDLTGTTNPITITMDGSKSIGATFGTVQVTLTLTGSGGAVSVDGVSHALPWSGTFDRDVTVTLQAVPNSGYTFTAWSGDLTGAINPTTLLLDGDKNVAAHFSTAPGVVYQFPLDDPATELAGWTGWEIAPGTGWAYGPPVAGGGEPLGEGGAIVGADPGAAYTGANVIGYIIGGNYQRGLAPTYLTTPVLNFAGRQNVRLHFWRWLGVEDGEFDNASIDINVGDGWETVWANPATSDTFDTGWTEVEYPLPQADGEASVQVRWVMGATDSWVPGPGQVATEFGGWSLDDISFTCDADDWAVTGTTLPTFLAWGQSADFSLTLRNQGESTWDSTYSLLAAAPGRWGIDSIAIDDVIGPGGSVDLTGTVTAPPLVAIRYSPAPVVATSLGADDPLAFNWQLAQDDLGPVGSGPFATGINISRFEDVAPGTDGGWARFWTDELAGKVPFIVHGYAPTVYGPTVNIDRAQIAVFVIRATGVPVTPATGDVFRDVPADFWAADQIETAAALGIVSGYEDGTYQPLGLITRGAMCKYIALGRAVIDSEFDPTPYFTEPPFPDVAMSNPFATYIKACKDARIVEGYTADTFAPFLSVDRAQLSVFVWRGFMRDFSTVVVLGGPDITTANVPGSVAGFAGSDAITAGDTAYAYTTLDILRLDVTDTPSIVFEFRDAATPSGTPLASLSATVPDLAAIQAAAQVSGIPYVTCYASLAGLLPGEYTMSTVINGTTLERTVPLEVTAP